MKHFFPHFLRSSYMKTFRPIGIVITALMTITSAAHGADPQRGFMLYETQCTGCHDSVFHLTGPRTAKSYADVLREVSRWAKTIELEWTEEEIEDVADYLNTQFYQYPCVDQLCSSAQTNKPTQAARWQPPTSLGAGTKQYLSQLPPSRGKATAR